MKEAVYLRKSQSDDPNEPLEITLAKHKKRILKIIGNKNVDWFEEVVSGDSISERPKIQELLQLISNGFYSNVYCIAIDRLCRGDSIDQGIIAQTIFYSSCLITTPEKTYDLANSETDRDMFDFSLFIAKREHNLIKKRLLNGKIDAISSGHFIGSIAPYGYNRKKLKKSYTLEANKDADTVKMIFRMCLDGVGTSNIANHLNKLDVKPMKSDVWNPPIIRNILTNVTYAGMLTWGKRSIKIRMRNGKKIKTRPLNNQYELVEGLHTGLVTKEEFFRVQEILKSHPSSKIPKNKEVQNALAGFVICGVCGRKMIRRPYNKSANKNKIRVYEIDKPSLLALLREKKEKSGLSLTEIANKLDVTKDVVVAWFTPNIDKFYLSSTFTDKWYELKKLLNIKTNKYDKSIMTYDVPKPPKDTLMCSLSHCSNVSSTLEEVEQAIIGSLEAHLKDFRYYLDNYEEEVKKVVVGNTRVIKKIQSRIEKLKKEKKNALRNYNAEDMTRDEYLELKQDIEEELYKLEEEKAKLEENKEEDKIIRYKKAIPNLSLCINSYDKLTVENKNNLLKAIIDKVIYIKKDKSTKSKKSNFNLEVHLKI